MSEWVIIYLRPDGWWLAGRGWDTRDAARSDAREQLPGHVTRRVVRLEDALAMLCPEALEEETKG
jgi:hypothetical protein